jgi:solute carrier family 8 (sodium/calcium exchanger)
LLVISGCSIIAVGTEKDPSTKKVDQLAVFAVTSIFSLFAYIWMYFCLAVNSPNYIELWEAIVTLVLFFSLIVFSYMTDRLNTYLKEVSDDELAA